MLAEISESQRGQEVFYLEFDTWIAEMAKRLGLKQKNFDRIHRLARDEGISFLVPEGLLMGDAKERRRWRQEHFKALFPVDENGEQRESVVTLRMAEMAALEEREFTGAYPRRAAQLEELEARARSGKLSISAIHRLDRLRWFRVRLGFDILEQSDS
jgi:hypothetical protein